MAELRGGGDEDFTDLLESVKLQARTAGGLLHRGLLSLGSHSKLATKLYEVREMKPCKNRPPRTRAVLSFAAALLASL